MNGIKRKMHHLSIISLKKKEDGKDGKWDDSSRRPRKPTNRELGRKLVR